MKWFNIIIMRARIARLQRKIDRSEVSMQGMREAMADERWSLLVGQIGLMTVKWAAMESMMDMIISILQSVGGIQTFGKVPNTLEGKLSYFRKIPEKMPVLAHLRGDIGLLCEAVDNLKNIRHALTHGMPIIDPRNPFIILKRLSLKNNCLNVIEDKVTHATMVDASRLIDIGSRLANVLAANICKALGKNEFEKVFRDLIRANDLVEPSSVVA